MTSVAKHQQLQQRQLALMLALGELVAVEDPQTGETHYMATQLLRDRVEGVRCDVEAPASRRPRHAKQAPPIGWRLRTTMLMIAGGVILVAAMPSAVSASGRVGVHRLIDEENEEDMRPLPVPATRRVAELDKRVAAPVAKEAATASRRRRVVQVLTTGKGKHRAHDKSSKCSNVGWEIQRRYGSDGQLSQVETLSNASHWAPRRGQVDARRTRELTYR